MSPQVPGRGRGRGRPWSGGCPRAGRGRVRRKRDSSPLDVQAERRNDHASGDQIMLSPATDPRELAGKRALVTGGSEGIGGAIVQRLSDAGATVVAAARRTPAKTLAADAAEEIGRAHV